MSFSFAVSAAVLHPTAGLHLRLKQQIAAADIFAL